MGLNNSDSTLLSVVDQITREDPSRLYCIQPISSDISQGWKRITFRDVLNASNRMAYWIQKNVASPDHSQVLAYSAANDIRYVAFVLACMRLRHIGLLLSSRNSPHASQHLINTTECSKLLYSAERKNQISGIIENKNTLKIFEIPALWDIYTDDPSSPLIGELFDNAEDRVAIYIHTSGTTGMPKLVPLRNSYFHTLENLCKAPVPENRKTSMFAVALPNVLAFSPNPFSHIMGIFYIAAPMLFGTSYVVSPERPLSAELLAQILEETQPRVTAIAPSVLEDLSTSELGMKCIASFEWISYGGAPMDPEIGDRISKIVHLQAVMGASECSFIASLKHQDPSNWQCHEWNPLIGYEMREVAHGLFELIIRGGEHRVNQAIFRIFPDRDEYCTGDLFSPHPDKPNLWYFACRKDDIIVLSNGEKFNPSDMEGTICTHPQVSKVIVLGQGRFQSAAIIEAQWESWNGDSNEFINEIWPTVELANELAPGYAKLSRNRICVSSASKPFLLTPKGSVKRKATLDEYKTEVDALYGNIEEQFKVSPISKDSSKADIVQYVANALASLLDNTKIGQDDDIFSIGLDSLQTLRLSQQLLSSLNSGRTDLAELLHISQIYSRPSISQISEYIFNILHDTDRALITPHNESDFERDARIAEMIRRYTFDVYEEHAVLLTGSTGSLGTYILFELLKDPSVVKIYCLNRSSDAHLKQLKGFEEKGLVSDFQSPRVEFLQVKLSSKHLGLDDSKYVEMAQCVDTIIHNAWKVNFNHKLEAFENPHIRGVQRLVDFSVASAKTAHLHFISSISTIEGSHRGKDSIPETIFEDSSVALRQGYAESKHVAERICASASVQFGVPTSIHRIGQIAGPDFAKGMWNKQEWLPSIMATSKTMKMVPDSLGSLPIQWIPVDSAARVVIDLIRSRRATQDDELCSAFHIINPNITDWNSLLPTVMKYFDAKPVPIPIWVDALKQGENISITDLETKPALKILDTLAAMASVGGTRAKIETTKTVAASATLRGMKAIEASQMENWLSQWNF